MKSHTCTSHSRDKVQWGRQQYISEINFPSNFINNISKIIDMSNKINESILLKFYTFVHMLSQLTPTLFWDTDISTLSVKEHSAFIIQRVCMLGSWEDWLLLKDTYGIPTIERELLSARYLDKKTLNYFSIIFNKSKDNFRCFSTQQSAQGQWNY